MLKAVCLCALPGNLSITNRIIASAPEARDTPQWVSEEFPNLLEKVTPGSLWPRFVAEAAQGA